MTETERNVNDACEGMARSGMLHAYRDLYKDLRQRLPCIEAAGLVRDGLYRTRGLPGLSWDVTADPPLGRRPRAIASLNRLIRWALGRERVVVLGGGRGT